MLNAIIWNFLIARKLYAIGMVNFHWVPFVVQINVQINWKIRILAYTMKINKCHFKYLVCYEKYYFIIVASNIVIVYHAFDESKTLTAFFVMLDTKFCNEIFDFYHAIGDFIFKIKTNLSEIDID